MNVVVSGTSSGIGKAIAQQFLDRGHSVFGYDVCAAALAHPNYTHYVCDIRDTNLPRPDAATHVLINSAGTLEESEAIDVNLKGAINFTQQFASGDELRSILFIASASARNGAEFPLYVASKAGVVGYMKNLALEAAKRGVTCNSISPGGVVTPANDHILQSEELYAQVKGETLLGKWALPSEIADLAYFLTVTNRSITGEDILIDNGEMLKSNFIW